MVVCPDTDPGMAITPRTKAEAEDTLAASGESDGSGGEEETANYLLNVSLLTLYPSYFFPPRERRKRTFKIPVHIKGIVSRDFLTLVFFIKHLLLVLLDTPRKDFEFF